MPIEKESAATHKLLRTIALTTALTAAGALPLCLRADAPAKAQEPDVRPSLLIGITVEGLDADMLELLRDNLGEGGFKRLADNAVCLAQPQYGPHLDPAAATAMLVTGAAPDVNGIPAAYIYEPVRGLSLNVYTDSATIGNFTNQTLSPAALLVSTVADQARIDADGMNYVYALAPHSQQALALGGHAANSAFWIDDITGKWATSTHYRDIPQQVTRRNYREPVSNLLDTLDWRPLLPLDQYPGLAPSMKTSRFLHAFPQSDPKRYARFKGTAPANTEVTDLALTLMHYQMLGKHPGVDVLSLAYTLSPEPTLKSTTGGRLETLDSYVRLDRDLARLFEAIDKQPGHDRTVVLLAGIPSRSPGRPNDPKWGIPGGTFSAKRARSLLNMYLIALHGNGDWVSGYHDRQFYLNHELIKQRGLDLGAVRTAAADFLTRMSGISHAYTIDDITAGRTGSDSEAMRRNIPASTAGDIVLAVAPGWEAVDDITGAPGYMADDAYVPSPIYIIAPGTAPRTIGEPVDVRRVAPTVARILRIRAPNAASLPPLKL